MSKKNRKDKERLAGFMLTNMALAAVEKEDGNKGFVLQMRYQTSPLLKKVLERDINVSLMVGAKPSEIAAGLRMLADKIIEDLPDTPHLVTVPKKKKIRT